MASTIVPLQSVGKKKRFILVKREVIEYEEETISKAIITNRLSEYIAQLSEQEIIVMKIAAEHLKTSFDMEKSSGYLQYLRK
jgi:hypothetical protein